MELAKDLMDAYLAGHLIDARSTTDLFAEHGTFEVPWLTDLGLPGRHEGRAAIEQSRRRRVPRRCDP